MAVTCQQVTLIKSFKRIKKICNLVHSFTCVDDNGRRISLPYAKLHHVAWHRLLFAKGRRRDKRHRIAPCLHWSKPSPQRPDQVCRWLTCSGPGSHRTSRDNSPGMSDAAISGLLPFRQAARTDEERPAARWVESVVFPRSSLLSGCERTSLLDPACVAVTKARARFTLELVSHVATSAYKQDIRRARSTGFALASVGLSADRRRRRRVAAKETSRRRSVRPPQLEQPRVRRAVENALAGRHRGWRRRLPVASPMIRLMLKRLTRPIACGERELSGSAL